LCQNGGLSVLSSIKKKRTVRWVWDDSPKFPGEKWSVRRCVVVMQQPVPLSPKFEAKSWHIFTQWQQNVTTNYLTPWLCPRADYTNRTTTAFWRN
jgi:hypothetical protein